MFRLRITFTRSWMRLGTSTLLACLQSIKKTVIFLGLDVNLSCCFVHRSGTDEEVTEKGQLLQELSDIYAEKDVAVQRRAEANANERQLAVQACDMACVALAKRMPPSLATSANRLQQSRC